jgi:two-component system, chemotaxis family, chemotaxis protein CheY
MSVTPTPASGTFDVMVQEKMNMCKFVIVDDSPIIHRLLINRLKSAGHEVIASGKDGNEGFALYCEHKPDLVLMDITMPNCDGREALKKVMQHSPEARVVMLSAISEPQVIEECLQSGALDFISKDRLKEEGYLEGKLKSILQEKRSA